MNEYRNFYINGAWVKPHVGRDLEVIDPSTEEAMAVISLGGEADVDDAVTAARTAFNLYSKSSVQERLELLRKIQTVFESRADDISEAVSAEMGAPKYLASGGQVQMGWMHFPETIRVLESYQFEQKINDRSTVRKVPVGVCGLITPWNWPLNQILCKVLPALAAGCTMILKPSEIAPINALILAEIMDEAGVPKGVFNLVNGDGSGVGTAMSSHPGIDMMSFTGSTRAGIQVAERSAATVKRVTLELGGKSANILIDGADFPAAIRNGVNSVFLNSGQTCAAPSRLIVPKDRHDEVCALAKLIAEETLVVNPQDSLDVSGDVVEMIHSQLPIGPVVSEAQFNKIQGLIQSGIDEGATLIAGGLGRAEGFERGYFVRPTIFGNVKNSMTIAREEIFGPVVSIIEYDTVEEAIRIANDSPYGLSGYVSAETVEKAAEVAAQMETGAIHLNGSGPDFMAPFGGVKKSGNGREWGEFGFEEYLENRTLIA